MILSIAHAQVDEASSAHVYGAWSNLLVGERPAGLVDCYLVQGDGALQIVAVWADAKDHDRAIGEEKSHPAYAVFEACGLDHSHSVFKVTGQLT